MASDEFQQERPQIQKEPSLSDARSETRLPLADGNRFQRPDLVGNLMSLTALCLGIVSLILSVWWVMTAMPWSNQALSFEEASFRQGVMKWLGPLQLVLGLTTLAFGILGLFYRYKPATLGGFVGSTFGIVMGILTILFGLFLCFILLLISLAGAGAMK
jgi:hypothetical protein